jgi:hypothetical protein
MDIPATSFHQDGDDPVKSNMSNRLTFPNIIAQDVPA